MYILFCKHMVRIFCVFNFQFYLSIKLGTTIAKNCLVSLKVIFLFIITHSFEVFRSFGLIRFIRYTDIFIIVVV